MGTQAAWRGGGRRRRLLWTVGALLGALLLWNGVLAGMSVAEARHVKRDPKTGIIVGAEPRDLGPPDSRRAALFVHGYAASGRDFADLPDRLAAQGWRVRVMLLPGHGTRPRELARTTVEELAAAVKEELAALRARHQTVVLVGFSMGGALSLCTAAEEDVDAVVLGAPYFAVTHHWYYGFRPETWAKALAWPVRWVYKGRLFLQLNRRENADRIIAYGVLPTRSMLTLGRIGQRARSESVLKAVNCPVLMIHSRRDKASSPEDAARCFESLGAPDKRIVWLERSNHHIFWDYEQDLVMETVLEFLEEVGRHYGNQPSPQAR